jgi:DNA-binding SARP family transcriptional activator/Flp pilus assembly protein TadD
MGRGRQAVDTQLELRLLGSLEVVRGERPVTLGGAKPRALLAALALEAGTPVSHDLLVETLWPGTPPETAPHAVQVYVSQLRKALGSGLISRRGLGYVLELDPEQVDARRFARLAGEGRELMGGGDPAAASTVLREALGLWRGPALADFLYEPFAQTEIARLEELRLDAVEARIDADLALGRRAELVSELEALVQAHPLREHPRAQLMLALYRTGRQADALAAYRSARETLVEELGIDPGHELRELESAILRQDESLLLPETAPAKPPMQFRRLVTILFVDVVESMALSDALDPEALGIVLHRYFETVSSALTQHGGTVEKYAGDAVMAVFGIPVSQEDHALRAARAALDIRTAIAALDEELVRRHGIGVDVRLGLEAGEVLAAQTAARQRLVTGEAVGIAAKLEQAADRGEILVGGLAGRLIDHAATIEPLDPLEIKGKRNPVPVYRLVELSAAAPAYARKLDAPFVGRKRELAALRRALKRAAEGASTRAVVVVGSPGIGKSRLAEELSTRAKDVTTLWGRCLAYGEGITFWPLREAAAQAPECEERTALLNALDTETPPSSAEIGLAFRTLCETLDSERPLLVVFDDVHWAEPTFLEVVEGVVDRADGPILVVCVAREELLDERPDFLGDCANAERIELEPLTTEETDALLDRLGGTVLESDQHARIVETAEGNPLFLEQLLALALEGGLTDRPFPATVQGLLAARLDRLGPGERAVLERGAVVGKEFRAEDVAALLDPEAVPTLDTHLRVLTDRGFLRSRAEGAFAFRHVLVQEAVYRAAPKRLRAELHERFADRLDEAYPDLPELDEFVGYHLEQAHRLRTELGGDDRRTHQLATDSGRRLGEAGLRALKRGDMHATVNLLVRATTLLPPSEPSRCELLSELGLSLRTLGESRRAADVLSTAIESARSIRDRRLEMRAQVEREYVLLHLDLGRTASDLLDAATKAIAAFETTGDDRLIGRAWLLAGYVRGGLWGRHRDWLESAERALVHYAKSGWPISTCLGEIATALYYGPTPVPDGIARCETLLGDAAEDRAGTANLCSVLGALVAQRGDFDEARRLIATAWEIYDDLGQRTAVNNVSRTLLGDVELLAGDGHAAESVLRQLCSDLEETHDWSHLASRASDLAEALYLQDNIEEAENWTRVAEAHAPDDDVDAGALWRAARAKVLARRGDFGAARSLAEASTELLRASDGLNRRARTHLDLGEVLVRSGVMEEAAAAFGQALALYEQKGNAVGAARARHLRMGRVLV